MCGDASEPGAPGGLSVTAASSPIALNCQDGGGSEPMGSVLTPSTSRTRSASAERRVSSARVADPSYTVVIPARNAARLAVADWSLGAFDNSLRQPPLRGESQALSA